MSLRRMIDRKLVLMVVTPIARAVISVLVGFLTAKGVPSDLLDQMVAAVGVASVVIFNIGWELIDRKRATDKAVAAVYAPAFGVSPYPFDHVRDRFERESG